MNINPTKSNYRWIMSNKRQMYEEWTFATSQTFPEWRWWCDESWLKLYDMRMKNRNTPLILGDCCTSNRRSWYLLNLSYIRVHNIAYSDAIILLYNVSDFVLHHVKYYYLNKGTVPSSCLSTWIIVEQSTGSYDGPYLWMDFLLF